MHLAMCIMYQLAIKDLKAVGARYHLHKFLMGWSTDEETIETVLVKS